MFLSSGKNQAGCVGDVWQRRAETKACFYLLVQVDFESSLSRIKAGGALLLLIINEFIIILIITITFYLNFCV